MHKPCLFELLNWVPPIPSVWLWRSSLFLQRAPAAVWRKRGLLQSATLRKGGTKWRSSENNPNTIKKKCIQCWLLHIFLFPGPGGSLWTKFEQFVLVMSDTELFKLKLAESVAIRPRAEIKSQHLTRASNGAACWSPGGPSCWLPGGRQEDRT